MALTLEPKMTSEISSTSLVGGRGGGTVGGRGGGDSRRLVSDGVYKVCLKVGVACWGRGLGWLNGTCVDRK